MIDLDTPVEYWHPQVGQRVRITGAIAECPDSCHSSAQVGSSGTVIEREPAFAAGFANRHPYHTIQVEYDKPQQNIGIVGSWQIGCGFASCEVEPVNIDSLA